MISNRQKWYGCQKRKKTEVVCLKEGKAQQGGAWPRKLEGTAKERGS